MPCYVLVDMIMVGSLSAMFEVAVSLLMCIVSARWLCLTQICNDWRVIIHLWDWLALSWTALQVLHRRQYSSYAYIYYRRWQHNLCMHKKALQRGHLFCTGGCEHHHLCCVHTFAVIKAMTVCRCDLRVTWHILQATWQSEYWSKVQRSGRVKP